MSQTTLVTHCLGFFLSCVLSLATSSYWTCAAKKLGCSTCFISKGPLTWQHIASNICGYLDFVSNIKRTALYFWLTRLKAIIHGATCMQHVPRRISAACSLFIHQKGKITCVVTGHRHYSVDLPQGGLNVPCHLIFSGENEDIKKMKKLLMRELTPDEKEPASKRRQVDIDLSHDNCTKSPMAVGCYMITLSYF